MTYASVADAMEDIVNLFRAVWGERPCDYPNTAFEQSTLDAAGVWARYRIKHYNSDQSSLARVDGASRYTQSGLITVQVFTPINSGVVDAYRIAESVASAYKGQTAPGGAWFRRVRIDEPADGADGLWYQLNVYAEFEYDRIN